MLMKETKLKIQNSYIILRDKTRLEDKTKKKAIWGQQDIFDFQWRNYVILWTHGCCFLINSS
jgi:hypothetical protein